MRDGGGWMLDGSDGLDARRRRRSMADGVGVPDSGMDGRRRWRWARWATTVWKRDLIFVSPIIPLLNQREEKAVMSNLRYLEFLVYVWILKDAGLSGFNELLNSAHLGTNSSEVSKLISTVVVPMP
ncbi:Os08g0170450 [Oryza sativa Japonica Group]|uniref:Os08g0170450 protein n=1 Tax=Oryza sativa subsp. japonica TaxID=39947 RepID=A0A0P0XCE3_ORYSJ|nr:Os08g0170450 [Oryza sativa Japonica Group]